METGCCDKEWENLIQCGYRRLKDVTMETIL